MASSNVTSSVDSSIDLLPPFATLFELREANRKLQLGLRDGGARSIVDDAENFIYRARATGALLEDELERLECQNLVTYWITHVYREAGRFHNAELAPFNASIAPELPDNLFPYQPPTESNEQNDYQSTYWHRLLAESLGKLREGHFVVLVGAAGSGRSSFIKSCLL